ncbi:unnamed protein product [Closterium sp. NIES-65]|nr:unnamed protein product [Closterium sp. NIES-65]
MATPSPLKSVTAHSWETEPEGALEGIVLEDDAIFDPVKAVKSKVSKLVPEEGAHKPTHCLARLRFHPNTEKQLNNMINVEYAMSYTFHSMSNYYARDCVGLPGLATLFMKRSNETRKNAIELGAYVSKRGGCVVLKPIAAPEGEYGDPQKGDALSGMELTLAMEKAETDKFLSLNKAAEDVVDEQLSDFLTDNFIDKQVDLLKLHAIYVSQLRRVRTGHVRGDGDPVREWILSETGGKASTITRISPVFGGCINNASRYETDVGSFFVKTNSSAGPAMFEAEVAGLQAMVEAGAIRVPRPFTAGAMPRRGSYVVMEFIEFGHLKTQAELGRQLALMHLQGMSPNGQFGFHCDNTIGSTPQPNKWESDWVTFFREHRLGHQLKLIRKQFADNALVASGEKLLEKLPELLGGVEVKPSLLHGDLWSGNIAADKEGNPVILDPATYYGHSEAEFGMSWCASFGGSFWSAYFEVLPKQPGFEERVEIYKLYHYLNHYNLFGSSYRSSCTSIINRFV